MGIVMSKDQSVQANAAIEKLVATDKDKAVEFFVTFGGMDAAAAAAHVEELSTAIAVAKAKDAQKEYFVNLREAVEGAVNSYVGANPLDDTVDEVKGEIKFDRSPHPDNPDEIIGWIFTVPKYRMKGEKRMKSATTRTGGGGGNGGTRRASVPTPDGVDSWQAHLADTYPEIVANKTGSYSAPKILLAQEDPVYMAAKAAAGM